MYVHMFVCTRCSHTLKCVMATIMMFIGNLDILMAYNNFVSWFAHGMSVVGLIWIRLRKIPVDNRAIRVRQSTQDYKAQ